MIRRMVNAMTVVLVGPTVALAVAWPEARAATASLAAALAGAGWWLAHRLPSRPAGRGELRAEAGFVLAVGIALALALPSTRGPCPICPAPRGGPVVPCGCPVNAHTGMRVAIVLAGAVFASGLTVASSRTSRRVPTGPLAGDVGSRSDRDLR